MADFEIWSDPVDVLYDLDWLQCRGCSRWHQVSEEFMELVNTKHSDQNETFVAYDPEGTTGPGTTCIDCGGIMGRWIPSGAIGSRTDGTFIFPGDPEDPNKG